MELRLVQPKHIVAGMVLSELSASNVTVVNVGPTLRALDPTVVTVEGIVMDVNLVVKNACEPIVVTDAGKVMDESPEYWNALLGSAARLILGSVNVTAKEA